MRKTTCARLLRGYTLVELLAVLAVVAILAAGSVPVFRRLDAGRTADAQLQALVSSLRLARAAAVERGLRVSVCQSTDGAQCTRGADARDWSRGWIVFVDAGTRGEVEDGDTVLAVSPPMRASAAIESAASGTYVLSFLPSGIATAAQNSFRFRAGGDALPRTLCISATGHPRVAQGVSC